MARPTNRDLLKRLREVANLTNFGSSFEAEANGVTGDAVRAATKLYRDSWLDPLLDEVERRLCGKKTPSSDDRT